MAPQPWTPLSYWPEVCCSCDDCRDMNVVHAQAWYRQETIHADTEACQAQSYLFLLLDKGSDLRRAPQTLNSDGLQVTTILKVSTTCRNKKKPVACMQSQRTCNRATFKSRLPQCSSQCSDPSCQKATVVSNSKRFQPKEPVYMQNSLFQIIAKGGNWTCPTTASA